MIVKISALELILLRDLAISVVIALAGHLLIFIVFLFLAIRVITTVHLVIRCLFDWVHCWSWGTFVHEVLVADLEALRNRPAILDDIFNDIEVCGDQLGFLVASMLVPVTQQLRDLVFQPLLVLALL